MLKEIGLQSFPMVTGGKGVHVVVPLKRGHSWDEHREFAEALARVMAERRARPLRRQHVEGQAARKDLRRLSAQPARRDRDLLRSRRGRGKGAPVAMPVSWEKLARLDNAHPVAVGEAAKFMGRSDPWPGYFKLQAGACRS